MTRCCSLYWTFDVTALDKEETVLDVDPNWCYHATQSLEPLGLPDFPGASRPPVDTLWTHWQGWFGPLRPNRLADECMRCDLLARTSSLSRTGHCGRKGTSVATVGLFKASRNPGGSSSHRSTSSATLLDICGPKMISPQGIRQRRPLTLASKDHSSWLAAPFFFALIYPPIVY